MTNLSLFYTDYHKLLTGLVGRVTALNLVVSQFQSSHCHYNLSFLRNFEPKTIQIKIFINWLFSSAWFHKKRIGMSKQIHEGKLINTTLNTTRKTTLNFWFFIFFLFFLENYYMNCYFLKACGKQSCTFIKSLVSRSSLTSNIFWIIAACFHSTLALSRKSAVST